MGNLERLLDALARKLPPASGKGALLQAVRAAADALPDSKAQTKARLVSDEGECVKQLAELLKARADAEAKAEAAERVKTPAPLLPGSALHDASADAASGYADIDGDDAHAVLARCAKLLSGALMGLRPALHAEKALEGLLALLPPEHAVAGPDAQGPFDVEALQRLARLVPQAAALLGSEEPPAWRRFLGFCLAAPLRLREEVSSSNQQLQEASARLGSIVALLARPRAARSALHLALPWLGAGPTAAAPARVAALAALPVVATGFGGGALDGVTLERSELAGLLQAARLVGLCRAEGVGEVEALDEARELLRGVLERGVDATPLLPELRRLLAELPGPRGKALRRRLNVEVASRAAAAAATLEALEAVATSVTPPTIARLAGSCGLPVGKEEEIDQRAAVARARGELFFEDVEGAVPEQATLAREDAAGGGSSIHFAETVAEVSRRALLEIDGIEALQAEDEEEQAGGGSKRALDELDGIEAEEEEEEQDGRGKKAPKKVTKKASAPAEAGPRRKRRKAAVQPEATED